MDRRASLFDVAAPSRRAGRPALFPSPASASRDRLVDGTSAKMSATSVGAQALDLPSEEHLRGLPSSAEPSVSVDPPGYVLGQSPLSLALLRLRANVVLQRLDLVARQKGEEPQVGTDVGVVDVDPELVEAVRRRQRGIEPHGARLRLAELRAVGFDDQRNHRTVGALPGHPADQVDPGGDVPPLVAPAQLHGAPLPAVQLQEVVGLEQRVAELGERDPRILALQAALHRFAARAVWFTEKCFPMSRRKSTRDRPPEPVEVVAHPGRIRLRVEVQELLELTPDPLGVLGRLLRGEELALRRSS